MKAAPSSQPEAPVPIPLASSDASCRVPLFVLFNSGAVWLVIASVFALIASVKFHAPNLLADCPWLTYGRIYPASVNALLYGFCLQAGLGIAIWMLARLGRTILIQPWLIAAGAKFWNLGVTVGVIAILAGANTGFENLEMPYYAALVMFLGYVIMSVWAVFTYHARSQRESFPSQWFLLAALFWFPWIYATANLLLLVFPVRGMTAAVIAWWYSGNLQFVWLWLVGLATIFYFVPKLTNRPLYSRYFALFTFWSLMLFGSWCGIPGTAPVPAWIPTLSSAITVLTVLTVMTFLLNLHQTLGGRYALLRENVTLRFIGFGIGAFLVSALMNILSALPEVNRVTQLTWFTRAAFQLNTYGFFAMTLFGAIYYISPRVTGLDWPLPKLVRVHFWCAAAGTVLLVIPLAVGGIVEGLKLNDPALPFPDIVKAALHFLRVSTIGDLLIALGNALFAANLIAMAVRYCRTHVVPVYQAVTTPLKPAEAQT